MGPADAARSTLHECWPDLCRRPQASGTGEGAGGRGWGRPRPQTLGSMMWGAICSALVCSGLKAGALFWFWARIITAAVELLWVQLECCMHRHALHAATLHKQPSPARRQRLANPTAAAAARGESASWRGLVPVGASSAQQQIGRIPHLAAGRTGHIFCRPCQRSCLPPMQLHAPPAGASTVAPAAASSPGTAASAHASGCGLPLRETHIWWRHAEPFVTGVAGVPASTGQQPAACCMGRRAPHCLQPCSSCYLRNALAGRFRGKRGGDGGGGRRPGFTTEPAVPRRRWGSLHVFCRTPNRERVAHMQLHGATPPR
jgi:hypothetical protein